MAKPPKKEQRKPPADKDELRKFMQQESERRLKEGTKGTRTRIADKRLPGDEEFAARVAARAKRRR